jgi:transcriptional regulator with XRE-family HTH domain
LPRSRRFLSDNRIGSLDKDKNQWVCATVEHICDEHKQAGHPRIAPVKPRLIFFAEAHIFFLDNKVFLKQTYIMNNSIDKESRALELAIAKRIRKRRRELDWTLDDLAKTTGLSKGHLSQIENGEKIPPIGTLTKIAFGLDIQISTLITGGAVSQSTTKIAMGKKEDRMPIVHTEASPNTMYESFNFTKQDRFMDTYIVTMGPDFPPTPMMHVGQEFVYTIEGVHEFFYDGQIYRLDPGDAIYFDSDRPHMGRCIGKDPAKLLVVFCSPPKER